MPAVPALPAAGGTPCRLVAPTRCAMPRCHTSHTTLATTRDATMGVSTRMPCSVQVGSAHKPAKSGSLEVYQSLPGENMQPLALVAEVPSQCNLLCSLAYKTHIGCTQARLAGTSRLEGCSDCCAVAANTAKLLHACRVPGRSCRQLQRRLWRTASRHNPSCLARREHCSQEQHSRHSSPGPSQQQQQQQQRQRLGQQ